MDEQTAAVIAAYNEEKHIAGVINKVKNYISTIIVVDDGSTDNTSQIAEQNNAIVLKHVINLGKGAATRTGCDYAIKKGITNLVLIDADGQHDPDEIPDFLKALESHYVVFGFRKFNKQMPFILKVGNYAINLATKILYGVDLRDTQSGYRALRSEAYQKIRWKAGDYSMESEMIANLGKTKLSYTQIPIKTIYSDKYKGTTIIDGIKIVFNMFLWRFQK